MAVGTSEQAPEQRLRIALGPFTKNLDTAAEALKDTLEHAGASVQILKRDLLLEYNPNDGEPLASELSKVDALVVPYSHVKPLCPGILGGHTEILKSEWAKLEKRRGIIWYRRDHGDTGSEKPAEDHLTRFNELAPVCTSEQAVLNLVLGSAAGDGIKIYIENNKQVKRAYWRVSAFLEELWSKVHVGPEKIALRCSVLNLNDLESAPQDAAGVILLMPLRLKDKKTLQDQISEVMKRMPKSEAPYPGCVAMVFQPPRDEPPTVSPPDWPYVLMRKQEEEPVLSLEAGEEEELEEFLRCVWKQYTENNARAAPAPLTGRS